MPPPGVPATPMLGCPCRIRVGRLPGALGGGKEGGEFSCRAVCPDPSGSGAGAGGEGRAAWLGSPRSLQPWLARAREGGAVTVTPGRDADSGAHPRLRAQSEAGKPGLFPTRSCPGAQYFPALTFRSSGGVKPRGLAPTFESWIFLLEPLGKSLNLSGLLIQKSTSQRFWEAWTSCCVWKMLLKL